MPEIGVGGIAALVERKGIINLHVEGLTSENSLLSIDRDMDILIAHRMN